MEDRVQVQWLLNLLLSNDILSIQLEDQKSLLIRQGIWQDAVVRIHIIRLLPHPLHLQGIFLHKTRKLLHISKKANCSPFSEAKITKRLIILKKCFTQNNDENTLFVLKQFLTSRHSMRLLVRGLDTSYQVTKLRMFSQIQQLKTDPFFM